jgi:hypothetical protein
VSSSRSVSAIVLLVAALAGAAGSWGQVAQAAAPRVEALVVGRDGWSVGPAAVSVPALSVGSCRLRDGLPIGVLRALGQPFKVEGSCGALYVAQVRDERERGAGGWVYKVGRRLPGRAASDAGGRLRSGQRVTWFWCRKVGSCGRTLVTSARSSGGRMRVTVVGYDDFGRGKRIPGATVLVRRVGTTTRQTHRTRADGTVLVRVAPGARYRVDSRRAGTVRGFPTEVRAR